jgi:uncharacterized membrane protein
MFPILTAIIVAFAQIIRKHGLTISNTPIFGVATGYLFAFLFYLVLLIFFSNMRHSLSLRKNLLTFWKAGLSLSITWIFIFYALSLERASIVTPLERIEPLFILIFTYLFFRKEESVTPRLVISALLIVFGAILVGIK